VETGAETPAEAVVVVMVWSFACQAGRGASGLAANGISLFRHPENPDKFNPIVRSD
jgi:hypothetical protein